jgi:hypothetical protein
LSLPLAEARTVWTPRAASILSPGPNVPNTVATAMGSGRAAGTGSAAGLAVGIAGCGRPRPAAAIDTGAGLVFPWLAAHVALPLPPWAPRAPSATPWASQIGESMLDAPPPGD